MRTWRSSYKRYEDPKKQTGLNKYNPFLIKDDKFQNKGKGVQASITCKPWEGKYMGKLMENKGDFSKVCLFV